MSIKRILRLISMAFLATSSPSHAYVHLVDSSIIELPKIDLTQINNDQTKDEISMLLQKFQFATSNEEKMVIINELNKFYEEIETVAIVPTAQCTTN